MLIHIPFVAISRGTDRNAVDAAAATEYRSTTHKDDMGGIYYTPCHQRVIRPQDEAMTVTTSAAKRITLYIGEALRAMLDDGRVEGGSVSERVDRLAARYASLVHELLPQRWSVSDWRTVSRLWRKRRALDPRRRR